MSQMAEKLRARALQARREDRLSDAQRFLDDALALCRQSNDEGNLANTLTALGQIERDLGNNETALAYYEEAVAVFRNLGDALKLAHTLRHVADIQRRQHLTVAAEANYREVLALYRGHKQTPPLDLANAIRGYAILKQDAGESAQAKSLWQEARDLYAAVGIKEGVEESSRRLALIA
jgi:tetratricopeptide (TPR) repeat protein